jgi:protocatechuate 3,4-dioxygenase beta subunit
MQELNMRDRNHHLSRRRILAMATMTASGLNAAAIGTGAALAQNELKPTPACDDGDAPTLRQIEGPFYKPRSPERADLTEPGAAARLVELSGHVLTRRCRPAARALLDLWHADENGDYDDGGFRYRGHVFTDPAGRYSFRTIMPAPYPGRTRHYHFKVLAAGRQLLTTQLYFPDEPMNRRDGLFRPELLMRIADAGPALAARFDFILDIR